MTAASSPLAGASIFLTGHTGFTGSWLSLWLGDLGCAVTGYSLAPSTTPALFSAIDLQTRIAGHHIGDIRDHAKLKAAMAAAAPSVVFHLAAQPLVRRSYADPLETFSTNVVGTASVLEAARAIPSVRAFVSVTTDKVYENHESSRPFVESDRLGGKDPYSASKACAEIVSQCYQQTMSALGNGMSIATVRGGNIIGGGDWSDDRIVPDFYRAASSGHTLKIRYPDATRPWQHVLSACHGYMAVGARLLTGEGGPAESWNIGPSDPEPVTVRQLLTLLGEHSTPARVEFEPTQLHEASNLLLDTSKARSILGFAPPWSTRETVKKTAEWYGRYYRDPRSALETTLEQLRAYRGAIGEELTELQRSGR